MLVSATELTATTRVARLPIFVTRLVLNHWRFMTDVRRDGLSRRGGLRLRFVLRYRNEFLARFKHWLCGHRRKRFGDARWCFDHARRRRRFL